MTAVEAPETPAVAEAVEPEEPAKGGIRRAGEAGGDSPERRRLVARFVRTAALPDDAELAEGLGGRLPALVYQAAVNRAGSPFPAILVPSSDGPLVESLPNLVGRLAEGLGEAEEAELGRHHLRRIEAALRSAGRGPLTDAFAAAAAGVREGIRLERKEAFDALVASTTTSLPTDAVLIPFGPDGAVEVALAEGIRESLRRGAGLVEEAGRLRTALGDLLAVESEHADPGTLRRTSGGALTGAFDFDALSHVIEEAPRAAALDPGRRMRIERLVEVLDGAPAFFRSVPVCGPGEADDWMDVHAGGLADLLAAVEAARLEAAHRYRPELHDALFDSFTAASLSREDLRLCPPVVVRLDPEDLDDTGVAAALRVTSDRHPFKVVAFVDKAAGVPGAAAAHLPGSAAAAGAAFVAQAALSDLGTWGVALAEGMSWSGPAVFALYVGPTVFAARESAGGAEPRAGAAGIGPGEGSAGAGLSYFASAVSRDGRAAPSFTFRPTPGIPWSERLSVAGNDQASRDWPVATLTFTTADGAPQELDLPFSWLDFAVMEPAFDAEFLPLAPAFEVEGLVPVDRYLALDRGERGRAIPFVWTVTPDGLLEKTVVTDRLVERAEAALDRWHRLRELGGIGNSFGAEAAEQALEEAVREREAALEDARRAHAAELDRAAGALAESIVANIAAGLLDLPAARPGVTPGVDTAGPARAASAMAPTGAAPSAPGAQPGEADVEETVPAPAEPEEEPLSLDEATIETPRCTSCNECTNLNGMIFAYNSEKQAFIKDASAGPYRDIVLAAEKCPVRIIHPGRPTNPSEQGLEELIERARPFL